ncbi:D-glucuronyl C5-epimerase B-like [Watersipora subatra]|uniref:D-glucuronyl C5-epimerase B-like n=1 Tax=Watersipora subatra TaxID=2589382 RepID=UPI00355B7D9D
MLFLRKVFPVKFANRLILLGISIFLCLLLMVIWNLRADAIHSETLTGHSRVIRIPSHSKGSQRSGSSNLILLGPVVVNQGKETEKAQMFEAYQQNPEEFVNGRDIAMPTRVAMKKPFVLSTEKGKGKKKKGGTPRVNCLINNLTTVTCMRATKTGEVYMPFKFIEKYFQVYGEYINGSSQLSKHKKGTFYFHHSNAPLWPTPVRYDHSKEFMFFGLYDVEGRSRVMLISGEHGVPVSSQWNKSGHIYPIQVAQFGLSHYSKYLTDTGFESDRLRILEDGGNVTGWNVPASATLKSVKEDSGRNCIYFNTLNSTDSPSLLIDEERIDSCLTFDVRFLSDAGNVSVIISANSGHEEGTYALAYHTQKTYKLTREDSMVYGIGVSKDWRTLHRDILVDFKKFAYGVGDWAVRKASLTSIVQLEVRGEGYIDNIGVSPKCHRGHFKDASNWLLRTQDKNGGWPVTVQRVVTSQKLTLPPGWYSAMGQGQAISLLVRAYVTYKEVDYLKAAVRGLSIYQNLSADHGVKAIFFDKHVWYEEYPTQPPLFVLNGFIYSLLGLYDLTQVAEGKELQLAKQLFNDGMASLKVMLPFFDSGTGTFYDLRHFTNPGIAPNRARWDYHTVHIAQLLHLGTIDSDPVFNATAQRWVGYLNGEWAPHN